jgi:AraC-like DNA-binding protein
MMLVTSLYSQEEYREKSKYQLSQLNYNELTKLADEVFENGDLEYLEDILNVHSNKAKSEGDTLELAYSYEYRVWTKSPQIAVEYLDSIIQLTKNHPISIFPSRAYYLKGVTFYEIDEPNKAMENFINGYYSSLKIEAHEETIDCLNGIAVLKSEFGEEREAINLHRKALKYLEEYSEALDSYQWTKLLTIDNMTLGFLELRELDSVKIYAKMGMELSNVQNDTMTHQKMNIALAQANFYEGNYLRTRDTLSKYINLYDGIKKADMLYYLGQVDLKLNKPKDRIEKFEEIHQIIKNDSIAVDNVKEVYKILLQDAISREDSEAQNEFLNWLDYYDTFRDAMEKDVRGISLTEFDVPNEQAQQNLFQNQISEKERNLLILYVIAFSFLIGALYFLFQYNKTQKRLTLLIQNGIQPKTAAYQDAKNKIVNIDDDTVNSLLEKLNNWEKDKKYLNTSVTQSLLAKELGTNSAYLSRIINVYKDQSFPNYLKDLRISYSINYIKDNPEIIKSKSTIQIAEYFGFNSLDVYARALKSKTGVTPGAFLKKVRQSNL